MQVIQELSDRQRFAVVPSFVGHGVGWHFHSAPVVSPVRNREPGVMVPGQTFTIEPILVEGGTRSKVALLAGPSVGGTRTDWHGAGADVQFVKPSLVESGTRSKVPLACLRGWSGCSYCMHTSSAQFLAAARGGYLAARAGGSVS